MLKKLEVLEDKYKELTEKISDPEVINDHLFFLLVLYIYLLILLTSLAYFHLFISQYQFFDYITV